ncbi:MAG: S46 family peptidase [Ignavibacteriaceae bacterium]|nr:S46 family peptidase [Ignavibacteriaceae bacterium]
MKILRILLLVFLPVQIFGQYISFNPDTVKAGRFDMGKMWTFENPPVEYFSETYNFKPSDEWLEKVRMAALRLSSGCSASFISEDGLVMTNHHCGRNIIYKGQNEGEDFLRDGFYAGAPENERRIPDLSLDQLIVVKDVTDVINEAMAAGKTDAEKLSLKDNKIDELISEGQKENPELQYTVVPLYNGGKHSLYGYKKYTDVRLVFAPDLRTAKLGGDYDNFTYPRYGLDCMFFRAYEDGKPVKTENYFEWSEKGGEEGELVFVIGNPGSTSRINTVAQMEFERDYINKPVVDWLKDLYGIIEAQVLNGNTENYKLVAELYSIGNGLKVYEGIYNGLNDPYLIARKGAFEKKFREAVSADANLKEKYGHLWDEIAQNREKIKPVAAELFGYNINKRYASELFKAAAAVVRIAEERKADPAKYTEALLDSIASAFYPAASDKDLQERYIQVQVNIINRNLVKNTELIKMLFDGKTGQEAKNHLIKNTELDDPAYVKELIKTNPDDILKSDDPLIRFFVTARSKLTEYQKLNKSLNERDEINNGLMGEALYAVYGETIPPDATFTLRINDGVIKGYDYNGTRAPVMTTFHGVLDRYYSFKKRFPFNLPPVWENLPKDFDLSTPLNFITTNDIIGGNSGSPMINKEGKIVGLIFDGNMESLTADFIYTDEKNRAIAVHSQGMIEAISDLYGAKDLAKEILQGRR